MKSSTSAKAKFDIKKLSKEDMQSAEEKNTSEPDYKLHCRLINTVFLIIYIGILAYTLKTHLDQRRSYSDMDNYRVGMLAAILVFITFGLFTLPTSSLRRPGAFFWRFIFGTGLVYMLILSFCAFQTRDQLLFFLRTFFNLNNGSPVPDMDYPLDCRIITPENPVSKYANITSITDFYIIAHVFGWASKMLIIRDFKMIWFLSIFFEFMELSFEHWLPEFPECWWNHIILDVILSNGLGIFFAYYWMKFFKVEQYDWTRGPSNTGNIISNFLMFIKNKEGSSQDWHLFSSVKRFLSVIYIIFVFNMVDMSHFLNREVLWMPTYHTFLVLRLALFGFLAFCVSKEFYEWINNKYSNYFCMIIRRKYLGPYFALTHIILLCEYIILGRSLQGFILILILF